MRNTPFFKFDAMSWLGGSIQFATLEEKGFFIDLCAMYWKSWKPIQIDSKVKVRYRHLDVCIEDVCSSLCDLGVILESEAGYKVPFIDELMNDREEWLSKCSKAGKKSASRQGTSTNKKEERRKKKEECREKREDKKVTKRAQHDAAVFSSPPPEKFQDLQFCEMWQAFCDHRAEMGDGWLTARSIKALFNKLQPLSVGQAIECLNNSIAGGWKGVFPEKIGNGKTYGKPQSEKEDYGL